MDRYNIQKKQQIQHNIISLIYNMLKYTNHDILDKWHWQYMFTSSTVSGSAKANGKKLFGQSFQL